MTHLMSDVSTMATRSLRLVSRDVDAMITAVVLPVIILLMFVLVFGGAVDIGTEYINYVTPAVHHIHIFVVKPTAFHLSKFLTSDLS